MEQKNCPNYYLTLYKCRGWDKWGAYLSLSVGDFEINFENKRKPSWSPIEEKVVMIIDRTTGTFKQYD